MYRFNYALLIVQFIGIIGQFISATYLTADTMGEAMFPWWQDLNSMEAVFIWMQSICLAAAVLTAASIVFLWIFGNTMIVYLIEREQNAGKKIKAVEKAAEQIRKELLATQQNQDIAHQRLQIAQMDAGTLRKELERTRKRYSDAELALKDRIDELKDFSITQGMGNVQGSAFAKPILNAQKTEMLRKLLSDGPKGELDIISVLENTKSHALAVELKKILDSQGWATQEIVQSAFSNPPSGLVLVIHSKQTAPSYAKFLQRTLNTLDIPVSAQVNNKYREWSISMIVGETE